MIIGLAREMAEQCLAELAKQENIITKFDEDRWWIISQSMEKKMYASRSKTGRRSKCKILR